MAVAIVLAFFVGYFASVYSWSKVTLWINGAEIEIRALEAKAKALKAAL